MSGPITAATFAAGGVIKSGAPEYVHGSYTPSIFEALASVMASIDHVGKTGWNDHQKFNFRGIDAVVNAVGPALRKHGVIVVPSLVSASYETVQTTGGKAATACRVVVEYVFHGPAGDCIVTSVAGEAWDSSDKATSKAMSVAFRTALLQSLALPTDEPDPDASTYERAAPNPYDVARSRVRAAWEAVHGDFTPAAVLEDIDSALLLNGRTPSTDDLNQYAATLEGTPT